VSDILRNSGSSDEIMQKARRILDNSLIFGVSSMLALKSFISGDRKLLKESRFEEFKTNLYELLTSQQGMNTIIKAVKGIRCAAEELQRLCGEKISALERDILSINEASAKLYNYLKTYKDRFKSIFQECRNPIGETLNNILRLEELLLKSIRACIVSNQGPGVEQKIHALSREAEECKLLADIRSSDEVGRKLMTILTGAFERYSAFRNEELIKPMGELKRVCGINLELSKLFAENITEQLVRIKTPKFSWVVSPIPNAMFFNLYPLVDNAQYAVYSSIQKLYGEWNEFVNKIEKWWGMELDSEASTAGFDKLINEIREKKQNELYLFRNTYNQQKSVLENIVSKTDDIYNQILFEDNADAV
jgi:hypothetical protein